MYLVNPTGKGIRNDTVGAGAYGTPRGRRTHNGVDLDCVKGQEVFSPIDGVAVRHSKPDPNDLRWDGVLIRGKRLSIKLWYFRPFDEIIGCRVSAGQVIGYAQDIGEKYKDKDGRPADAHIHMKIERCDPTLLMKTLIT